MIDSINNFIDINVNQDKSLTINVNDSSLNSNYYEIEDLNVTENNFEYCSLHINIHSLPQKFDVLKNMLFRLQEVNVKLILFYSVKRI